MPLEGAYTALINIEVSLGLIAALPAVMYKSDCPVNPSTSNLRSLFALETK